MRIPTALNAAELTKLKKENSAWFKGLCELWIKRTTYDPVHVADRVHRTKRWHFVWSTLTVYIGLFVLIAGMVGSAITGYPLNWQTPGGLALIVFEILCVGISILASWKLKDGNALYPEDVTMFGTYLGRFFEWTGTIPERLEESDLTVLKILARNVLVESARQHIEAQNVALERRSVYSNYRLWLETKKRDFDNKHRCFVALGLAKPKKDAYYGDAKKKFVGAT